MKSNAPLERDIQSAILEYLHAKRIFCWRNNSGMQFLPYTNREGKSRMRALRIGLPGSSDILGCLPDGRFLAIEVKRPGNKPTIEQQEFLDNIASRGGVAFVATSIDDVIAKLG